MYTQLRMLLEVCIPTNATIQLLSLKRLVWSGLHFRPYLLGHHVTVLTDHSACTSLLNASKPSVKLARWAMIVQEFDLTIRHRSGKSNANADALSRNPITPSEEVADVLAVQSLDSATQTQQGELADEQAKDLALVPVIIYLRDDVLPDDQKLARKLVLEGPQYDLINGVLHHENPHQPGSWRVVVPGSLRGGLMEEMHGGRFSGHFAWRKMYCTMRKKYWWKGMCSDVERFCNLSGVRHKEGFWSSCTPTIGVDTSGWTVSQDGCGRVAITHH